MYSIAVLWIEMVLGDFGVILSESVCFRLRESVLSCCDPHLGHLRKWLW